MRRAFIFTTTLLLMAGVGAAQSVAVSSRDDRADGSLRSVTNGTHVTNIRQVTAGIFHTCALDEAGRAYCWGRNVSGSLGQGVNDVFVARWPLPVQVLDEPVAGIAAGGAHFNCVVTAAGAAKCWGNGCSGQLGNGRSCLEESPPLDFPEPEDVMGLQRGVAAVVTGFRSACAVTTDGEARCWGRLGVQSDRPPDGVPYTVPGLERGVIALAGGVYHFCALMADATVRCWGDNDYGQLGDGTTDQREEPMPVPGLRGVLAIGAGTGHTCALMDTRGVKCWGDNDYGQLGDGTTELRLSPVDVVGLTSGVRSLTAGGAHTCVVLDTGRAMCWGRNQAGQLGVGTADWRDEPHSVPALVGSLLDEIVGISASVAGHSRLQYKYDEPEPGDDDNPTTGFVCAILSGGSLRCWGANAEGQLGDGSRTDRPSPVAPFWPVTAAFLPNALPGR
jgi:alpha-tubulin suppressor-like RCC1 family protein